MCKSGLPLRGPCVDCDDLRLIDQADVLVGPEGEKTHGDPCEDKMSSDMGRLAIMISHLVAL